MNKIEIVKKAFSFATPEEEKRSYYADDFKASDVSGAVWDKTAWLSMSDLYRASVPDAGFIFDEIHQDGEDVIATGHFTGTFMHDMDLSMLNLGVIKATGKPLKFPSGSSRVSFRGDKIIANESLTTGPEAGLAGFLNVFRNGAE